MPQLLADRFEVETFIAQGGMGSVYRGRDRQTGDLVAIKVLHSDVLARDPQALNRFLQEGEALRRLNHPNIVKLLTTISDRDQHYLVLDYVGGGSLRDLLRREQRLSVEATLNIALELVDALTRCHHLNIIHRDIKPENVLLVSDGTPRLTDFGIAHVKESSLTRPGEIVGTYAYLPPESWRGEPLDARADLWSLGVMLFELLTGQQPFAGDTVAALLNAILTCHLPDLEVLRPDVPTALVDLIYRMLEKNRDERIPTARLVAAELENILRGGNASIHTIRRNAKHATTVNDILVPITLDSATPTAHLHNLPVQPSIFVGREGELGEIARLLSDASLRLLTILGPGGMGKTRLALEASAQHLNVYRDGVYFVDLAPLTDPAQIIPAIAEAIRFTFYAGVQPKQQLIDYLREKHMLLLLDNFEHLVSGATLVADILMAVPNVKMLVTSRERLALSAETVFSISGLDFPSWETPADALAYAAVKLFLQSARRANPAFELTADMLTPVSRICRLVGGMPLGIVLAAAWVDMLSPAEIAAEIERSLDFLETELRDLPTRQRSLRAVFDYSWALLTPDEQSVFQRLSIFRGGFTRDAAHEVSGASLRTLAALVNQSLLQRHPDGRYAIHELLRQYAEARLSADPTDYAQTRTLHSAYYTAYLTGLEQQLYDGHELEMLAGVETEFDNIRVAWNWAVEQRHWDEIDAALICLWLFYNLYHRQAESYTIFSTAVIALRSIQHSSHACLLTLTKLQIFEDDQSDTSDSFAIIKVVEEHNLEAELGLHFCILLVNAKYEDDPTETRLQQRARHCIALARSRNHRWEVAYTCLLMGMLIGRNGQNWHETVHLMEESLTRFRDLSAPWGVTMAARWLSYNDYMRGEYAAALQNAQTALRLARMQPDVLLTSRIYYLIGQCCYQLGDYAQMYDYYEQQLAIVRELGRVALIASTMATVAEASIAIGDFARAETWLQASLTFEHDEKPTLMRHVHRAYSDIAIANNDLDSLNQHLNALTELTSLTASKSVDERQWHGKVLLAQANYEAAIHDFEDIMRTNVYDPSLREMIAPNLILLGRALSGASRHLEAEKLLQAAWQNISAEGLQNRINALCSIAELLAAESRPESFGIATLVADHPASTAETRLRATRLLSSLTPATTLQHDLSTIDALSAWILADDGTGLVRT